MNSIVAIASAMILITIAIGSAVGLPGGVLDGSVHNCPPHPYHCDIPSIGGNGATLTVTATVQAKVAKTAAIQLALSATAKVIVTLSFTSNASNASTNATVFVNDSEGVGVENPHTQVVELSAGESKTVEFPFTMDQAIPPGDVLYVPVAVVALDQQTSGFAPFQVAPPETPLLIPLVVTGLTALLAGGGGTYLWLRRKDEDSK